MVSPSSTKPLLRTLAGERQSRPPFWFMRQAGRYLPEYRALRARAGGFLDLCYTPEFAVEVTMQPIRRFGMDAAILFSDILVVPDALGQPVSFREGVGPVLERLGEPRDVDGLSRDGLLERLAPVFETVRGVRAALPEGVALIGFAGAPWTVATYMIEGGTSRDHGRAKSWALADPEGYGRLSGLLVDATADYLCAQVDAGAEVLQLFDTWAGVLPDTAMRRWCLEPVRTIAARVHERHPGIPIIAFPRGVGANYTLFAECGDFAAVGLDGSVSPRWASALQRHCAVQGNLDPWLLAAGGDVMREEALRLLDGFRGGPSIFNLGHGVLPQTPVEHVAELCALLREWRVT